MAWLPAEFIDGKGEKHQLRFWLRESGFVLGFTAHPIHSVGWGVSLYLGWWSYTFALATPDAVDPEET